MYGTLPLTPLEQYIYHMHCPSHPWIGHTRLIFEGQLDSSQLQKAIRIALKKHPLLSSTIATHNNKLYWNHIDHPTFNVVSLPADNRVAYPQVTDICLEDEIGIKVFKKPLPRHQSAVYFQVHHACCDGQGFSFFLQDVLIAYDALHHNTSITPPAFNLAALKQRAAFALPFKQRISLTCQQLPGLAALVLMMTRTRQGISSHPIASRSTITPMPHHCERMLDPPFIQTLALAARKLEVTSNDLMLRELMITIGEWQHRHNIQNNHAWFRMMIPMTLRVRNDYGQSAINKFSMVMLERQHKSMLKPERLLQRIHEDMSAIKRFKLGHTFIMLLSLAQKVPGGLRWLAHSNLLASSTVFSNLGKLFQRCPLPKADGHLLVGNTRLIQFDALAVVSYPQCASFITSQYAGHLNLNMAYHPAALSAQTCHAIMDQWLVRLQHTAKRGARA